MAEIHDLFAVDASNIARWPEGMAPSTVNNGARATEGILARYYFDTNHSVVATLSGTVIQMTANRTSITLTGTTSNYVADLLMAFTMGSVPNINNPLININGIGAISLRDVDGASISASVLMAGTKCLVTMDATNNYFRLLRGATQKARPAFSAYNSVTDTNQTGNGATATVDFDTEIFDQGGNFAADTFTAPVTGRYQFNVNVDMGSLTTLMTSQTLALVTTARTYGSGSNIIPPNGAMHFSLSVLADMTAGDTALVRVTLASGAGDTASILGTVNTNFSGYLVA